MRMPIPAAANAGDAAQNPKTDKGDPLAGFQPWIFKLLPLHPAHAGSSHHPALPRLLKQLPIRLTSLLPPQRLRGNKV